MQVLSIMQPAYIPWLGFFSRILESHKVVMLDTVQLDWSSKTKFANRNKIRNNQGEQWLTVPLLSQGEARFLPIREIGIDASSPWIRKHLQSLRVSYSKAPFFDEFFPDFDAVLKRQHYKKLGELLKATLEWFFTLFDLSHKIMWSSQPFFDACNGFQGSQLIFEMCKVMNADCYISGPFGRDYLEEKPFAEAGIKVRYHSYVPNVYSQNFPGFIGHLSVLDALFNVGAEETLKIARQGGDSA